MACALTQGYRLGCRDSAGGVKSAYFIELENVTGVTSASGIVSAIGKANNKRFWKYNLQRATAGAEETITGDSANGTVFYAQSLNIVLNKMQAATRNEIILLDQNHLMVVIEDRNGKYWLYGQTNGLELSSGKSGTGTALGDRNGYELTFTGEEPALALEVSSGVITGLETP